MKPIKKFLQEIAIPIDKGDEILVGRFKNRKAIVKGFDKDKVDQPVLKTTKGDHHMFRFRVSKLMPKKKETKK